MPILPPGPGNTPSQLAGGTCSFKGLDIVTMALIEIGVIDPSEQPTATEANNGLIKLNRLLDAWNADGRYIFTQNFTQYTLVPSLQPHTIGPSGATFYVPQRPVKILNANIILNAGEQTSVRSPVKIRDAEWWNNNRAYAVQSTLPTDMYYQPDWPNGSMFLWVVPTQNYPLEIETWTILGELQLNSTFCMPPGYMDAVVYALAVSLCPSYGREVSPTLAVLTTKAIQKIWSPNLAAPQLATRDAGVPDQGIANRPTFNYLSGLTR